MPFTHAGKSYWVTWIYQIRISSDDLFVLIQPGLPDGTILKLDNRTFTIDRDSSGGSLDGLEVWDITSNPLGWTAGQHVTVSLKFRSPQTGVGGLRRDRRVGEGCWQFT